MKQIKQIVAQRRAISWLARLQSDNIQDVEKEQFFSWLENSSVNQAAYIQAESLWEKGDLLVQQEDDEHQRHHFLTGLIPQNIFYSGFSIACAIFIFFVFFPSTSTEIIYTESKQQKTVALEDGSLLTLNPNTKISVTFDHRHRHVLLHAGRVFFDVTTDQSRPFEVETDLGFIKVLGTAFSVETTTNPKTKSAHEDNRPDVIVTVLEGKVGVTTQKNNIKPHNTDNNYTLVKNEKISLNEAALGRPIRAIDATNETAWRKGQLIYEGESLRNVIKDLEYYNNVKIELTDNTLAKEKLHATLSVDNIELSLASIAHTLDLNIETIIRSETKPDSTSPTFYILSPN